MGMHKCNNYSLFSLLDKIKKQKNETKIWTYKIKMVLGFAGTNIWTNEDK